MTTEACKAVKATVIRFPLILWTFFVLSTPAWAECREDTVWIRGDFGTARFAVEIADDPQERAQGLMHRTELATSAGMLFVFQRPQSISFWMRNTLIELDLIFADPAGTIKHIHHRAQPLDETPIPGGDGLTHVLEINGGMAKTLGIDAGNQLQHPSFDQSDASWGNVPSDVETLN